MELNTHTPGPWAYAKDFDAEGQRAKITTVAVCADFVIGLPTFVPGGNYRDGDPSGCAEYDARLIASAPELLEALQTILADRAAMGRSDKVLFLDEALDMARIAANKATGGEV